MEHSSTLEWDGISADQTVIQEILVEKLFPVSSLTEIPEKSASLNSNEVSATLGNVS